MEFSRMGVIVKLKNNKLNEIYNVMPIIYYANSDKDLVRNRIYEQYRDKYQGRFKKINFFETENTKEGDNKWHVNIAVTK